MLFNTAEYIAFFLIIIAAYYIIPKKTRYILLLAASYFFYMNWSCKYGILLVIVTISTYIGALLLDTEHRETARNKAILFCTCIVNVGLLAVFKYASFILDNISIITDRTRGAQFDFLRDLALPVGISFYTFQALSYVFDVYSGKTDKERNLLKYALFVSFFPQLVAGPIERSTNLLRQISEVPNKARINYEAFSHGFTIMLWGFFMKMVIADRIAVFVDLVFDSYFAYGGVFLALAAIGFSMQIYCDFAGYSAIAIGSAQVLGFSLMENFRSPYLSGSIKEFWQRWHISLSSWFRDYVYIPLGGSRRSRLRNDINVFLTMCISGLWHGASWSFVAWGGVHGLYQIIEKELAPIANRAIKRVGVNTTAFSHKLLKRIITYGAVTFAWILFRAGGFMTACSYIAKMLRDFDPWVVFDHSLFLRSGLTIADCEVLVCSLLLLLVVDCIQYKTNKRIDYVLSEQNLWFRWFAVILIFTVTWVYGVYGPAFESSQFIYFQF